MRLPYASSNTPKTTNLWCRLQTLALLAPALLTGCLVGPKYHVPPTQATAPTFKESDPAVFKETADWHIANPNDTIPRGDWWTLFNDPSLNTLEPKIAAANQTLQAAAANLAAARANVGIQNANRYPTVGLSPFLGGERDSATQPYFNAANANSGDGNLVLPLQLNYEIDLWGAVRRSITSAKENSQASAAMLQNVLLSLQAELATDYFELRAADAQQKLLIDTVAQYQDAVRVTNNRFVGGIAAKSDLTQAQTQLQAAKVAAADVAIARSQYEHAIAMLTGQQPEGFNLPPAPLVLSTRPPAIPTGIPSQLLERRPDIAAAERQAAAANEQIGIARAAFFPSVNLSAIAGFESTAITSLFNRSSFIYTLGPTIAETFFDGGRRRSISEQALASYDQTAANYRQTVLTAYQQVEDNLVALRILSDEQAQQRSATSAAQESERIFNNRYVGGVDTYLQVITAQTTALNNERNDIDILRRRMDASILLVKALGGGWDRTQLPAQ